MDAFILCQQLREMCEVAAFVDISSIQIYNYLPDFCGNLAVWFECGVPMDECALSIFLVIGDPSVDGSRCHGELDRYP